MKARKIKVQESEIRIEARPGGMEYICISDMLKAKEGQFFLDNWLRNRNTLEFLAVWEVMHNPDFNSVEFDAIKSSSGLNSFKISVKEWCERTGAIGITARAGRYGGTFAHEDIAMEFGTWISPQFKLYLIKEFKRLKKAEEQGYGLEWQVRRTLAKTNYLIHTDAVKHYLLPSQAIPKDREWLTYASEADLLNLAVWGCTARQWKDANPQDALQGKNIRDIASINELIVLSNLESLNALMISQGNAAQERLRVLWETAQKQLELLNSNDQMKAIRRTITSVPIRPRRAITAAELPKIR